MYGRLQNKTTQHTQIHMCVCIYIYIYISEEGPPWGEVTRQRGHRMFSRLAPCPLGLPGARMMRQLALRVGSRWWGAKRKSNRSMHVRQALGAHERVGTTISSTSGIVLSRWTL